MSTMVASVDEYVCAECGAEGWTEATLLTGWCDVPRRSKAKRRVNPNMSPGWDGDAITLEQHTIAGACWNCGGGSHDCDRSTEVAPYELAGRVIA